MRQLFKWLPGIFLIMMFTGCNKPVSVLLVTGGHAFDTVEFLEVFDEIEGIVYDQAWHPEALELLRTSAIDHYDVLVFYDFMVDLPESDSSVYKALTAAGKPMLFMHHALCNLQRWDGYLEMVGGRYVMADYEPDSTLHSGYRHDIDLDVNVVDREHPVTLAMEGFTIHDEGYSNIRILPGVTPLLTTDHPDCAPLVGWTHTRDRSNVVYLMLGHDRYAYEHQAFRQLVRQSIFWLAGY